MPVKAIDIQRAWREWAPIALWIAAFVIADRWFDLPIVFSAPGAFLAALVYGYFARERSRHRKADLIEAAAAAWGEVEEAAEAIREAERTNAGAEAIAARGEAYAAALDRSAIIAKQLAEYGARQAAGPPKTR
ncbi:hypothetical protein [Methylocapsa palsarum]|uniref:Uncharacterized protein n=1 Tax=Methylocapsa palsarum TaxID=1612308 RepID=A0A1I4CGP9_9HYPH|nr:hypothetical protein [Methylocapsa palsarum]SFK79477.1 hypothetical protein SAMN05444581_12139 [Methylocapsa palsarum]